MANRGLTVTLTEVANLRFGSPEVLTGRERKAVDKAFASHLRSHGPANPAKKPRCHIIACVATKNGATCFYHCVKH